MLLDKRLIRGVVLSAVLALVLVLLPALSVGATRSQDEIVHVVQPGDRLVDIAARYGVSASAIMRANSLTNSDLIFPGQRLTIPGTQSSGNATASPATSVPSAPAATATPAAAAPAQDATHTVGLGDTLDKIARRYGVSASAIIQANGLTNPDVIYVGQKLRIPSGAATTGSTTQTTGSASQPVQTPAPQPAPIKQTVHVVQSGDTLAKIAQKYRVSVSALVEANGLASADMIRVGQRLQIPGQGVTKYPGRATKFVSSISRQRCWLYQGNTVIAEWACSTGRAGYNTVPGTYKIQSKLQKAYGSTWNIWMPYWLGIYWAGASENGIHGLPWNAETGVQVWTGYVGTPITYGCVMLDNVNAKMLYDMAYIGMPVIVQR